MSKLNPNTYEHQYSKSCNCKNIIEGMEDSTGCDECK
jgi:hypothetical protein